MLLDSVILDVWVDENNYNITKTLTTSGKNKWKGAEENCANIWNFFNNVDTTKRQEEQNELILIDK